MEGSGFWPWFNPSPGIPHASALQVSSVWQLPRHPARVTDPLAGDPQAGGFFAFTGRDPVVRGWAELWVGAEQTPLSQRSLQSSE